MGQGTLLGFASQRERKEEETVAEVGRKLHAAIQAVLDAPAPTEEKVCQAARSLGCRILALHLSPHVGVGGEIRRIGIGGLEAGALFVLVGVRGAANKK